MASKIRRKYPKIDAEMFKRTEVLHKMFVEDMPLFTAFAGNLNAAFAAEWRAKIEAARAVTSDSGVVGQQKQYTHAVLEVMERCRNKYNEVKFFAKLAFPIKKRCETSLG